MKKIGFLLIVCSLMISCVTVRGKDGTPGKPGSPGTSGVNSTSGK
ncbi:hypothetical protein [uncultured Chryseobacterium sp.]|nr:hypothetical protein [uncultured Chryseobacterium sp.]